MVAQAYIGQRISFESALCTVRYIGPVQGTKGEWLGVEWDEPSKGKHAGEYGGVKYFRCKSRHPTPGSFVRPSRPSDQPLSFLEGLRKKYASDEATSPGTHGSQRTEKPTEWGGKAVEEVGFDKIRQQQSMLNELRIVLLDGLCIAGATAAPQREDEQRRIEALRGVKEICPKIRELDLSRNLLERWDEVMDTCLQLDELNTLKVNGNRFSESGLANASIYGPWHQQALGKVHHVSLENNLMDWETIALLVAPFSSSKSISASSNELSHLSLHSLPQTLTTLTLEGNLFESLLAVASLSSLRNLQSLHLRDNAIRAVEAPGGAPADCQFHFSSSLAYVDLSYNAIGSWDFIEELGVIFPGLVGLRVAHNPLFDGGPDSTNMGIEEGYMLTIARLGRLDNLNFSAVTPQERVNAEMYYLSRIAREAAEVPETEEEGLLAKHKRYAELCEAYGTPAINRMTTAVNPNTLEARLINFTFELQSSTDSSEVVTKTQQIPRTFDVYRLKGLVGRLFGVRPLATRLMWKTGEWDPVAGFHEDEYDSENSDNEAANQERSGDKWTRRVVELEDGTKEVGFWIETKVAKVRVELR